MTIESVTITPPPAESAHRNRSTESSLSYCFAQFLSAASDLVLAERDLAGYSGQDPAVDAWIRDAERAFDTTRAALNDLLMLSPQTVAEQRMLRLGQAFRFVMQSDDPIAVNTLRGFAESLAARDTMAGNVWRDEGAARLLSEGWELFWAYCALDDGLDADNAAASPKQSPPDVADEDDALVSAAA